MLGPFAARCGGPYGLLVDQRLKLLSDINVQLYDTLAELALAAILTFDREIKVFFRIAENINELCLGIDYHDDPPSSFERTTGPAGIIQNLDGS
jgi:hypothetical protein